jgi:ATPase subunit of ABC transporter with duplicated ATPase domains
MSIIVSDLSFHYPNQFPLFSHLSFSIEKQRKVSIVGSNGVGKSTLLKLMGGHLQPVSGSILASSQPYYIPQHTGLLHQSVAEAMHVSDKLAAFTAIMEGSLSQLDYDLLADDWEIESKCMAALCYWQLPHIKPNMSMDDLSGGEKTKVFLSGLFIHTPDIILLDEPSNHLDKTSRNLLYRYIEQSKATIVVVSHDVTLLNQLHVTYELSGHGVKLYGGNYLFYKEQKEIEINALSEDIHSEEKTLRLAQKKAGEVKQRQEKRLVKGEKNKNEVPRIFKKTQTNSSENTPAGLQEQHAEIINNSQVRLTALKHQKDSLRDLKIEKILTTLTS